jgi:uncharacterized protein (TIGR02246 family)
MKELIVTTIDDTAVKDLFAGLAAAWDANDADAYARLYADDASVVTSGNHSHGRDEIRAFVAAGFDGRLKGTTSAEQLDKVRFVADDVAIVEGVSGFLMPGEQTVRAGLGRRATWVLARAGGEWLVAAYHNSSIN